VIVILFILIYILHLRVDVGVYAQVLWWLIKGPIGVYALDPKALLLLDDICEHPFESQPTSTDELNHVILLHLDVPILVLLGVKLIENPTDRVDDLVECRVHFLELDKGF